MLKSEVIGSIYHSLIEAAPDFVLSLLLFLGFWLLASIVHRVILRIASNRSPQREQVIAVLASFAKVSIILVGIITALGSLGVNVSALVTSIGLSGFALSFAMKDTLSNLLAGILILLYQPFKINQNIKVGAHEGTVRQISLRFTHLYFEDTEILIPNSTLLTNSIIINGKNGSKHEK